MSGQHSQQSSPSRHQQSTTRSNAPIRSWRPEQSPTRLLRLLSRLPPKPSLLETSSISSREERTPPAQRGPPSLTLPSKRNRQESALDFEKRYNAIPKAKNDQAERRELYLNFYHKKIRHLGPADDTLSVFSNHSGTNFSRFDRSTASRSLPPLQLSDDEDSFTITTQQMVMEEDNSRDNIVLDTQEMDMLRRRQDLEALRDLEATAASVESQNVHSQHIDYTEEEEMTEELIRQHSTTYIQHTQKSIHETQIDDDQKSQKSQKNTDFNFSSRSSTKSQKPAQNAPLSIHSGDSYIGPDLHLHKKSDDITAQKDTQQTAEPTPSPKRDRGKGKEIIDTQSSAPSHTSQQDNMEKDDDDLAEPSHAFDNEDWGDDPIEYDYGFDDLDINEAPTVPRKQLRVQPDTRDFQPPPNRKRFFFDSFVKSQMKNCLDYHTLLNASNLSLSYISSQFTEQMISDLTAYKQHRIETSDNPWAEEKGLVAEDVLLLMKRQGVINEKVGLMQLARKYLPREFWEQLTQVAGSNNMIYTSVESKTLGSRRSKRSQRNDISSMASSSRYEEEEDEEDEEDEEEEEEDLRSTAASLFPGEMDDYFL